MVVTQPQYIYWRKMHSAKICIPLEFRKSHSCEISYPSSHKLNLTIRVFMKIFIFEDKDIGTRTTVVS